MASLCTAAAGTGGAGGAGGAAGAAPGTAGGPSAAATGAGRGQAMVMRSPSRHWHRVPLAEIRWRPEFRVS
eukprot:10673186-Alexandrium_andersonii.AAC.1